MASSLIPYFRKAKEQLSVQTKEIKGFGEVTDFQFACYMTGAILKKVADASKEKTVADIYKKYIKEEINNRKRVVNLTKTLEKMARRPETSMVLSDIEKHILGVLLTYNVKHEDQVNTERFIQTGLFDAF